VITKLIIFAILTLPVAILGKRVTDENEGKHYLLFSYLAGSFVAASSIAFTRSLTQLEGNAFMLALGIVVIVGLWKFLFGPWNPRIKVAVLGTFIFWIAVDILQKQDGNAERVAMILATIVAAVPAGIWCFLFLKQNRNKITTVVLTFFAGMLSTAPILFYDHVVRSGYDLHFFLFRITPEHFMRSSKTFVTHALTGQSGVISASVAATVVSFILVGVIEEWSKHWVVRKSDKATFSSITDVIQLSVIAGIGFAFAENVINPNYFIAFIKDYLIRPQTPQFLPFLGSVFGRAIITNMVHITCSGILGYYYGMAFFARPVMEDDRAQGKRHQLVAFLHKTLRIRRVVIFKHVSMLQGLVLSMGAHSMFDTMVSLPEVLPGNPQTIGAMLGMSSGPLNMINVVMLAAFIYVFGGWVLLRYLFKKRKDVKEYGQVLNQEVFVPAQNPA
jgi:RsiW-degrading membrane proteinase PrsW (M82 family)